MKIKFIFKTLIKKLWIKNIYLNINWYWFQFKSNLKIFIVYFCYYYFYILCSVFIIIFFWYINFNIFWFFIFKINSFIMRYWYNEYTFSEIYNIQNKFTYEKKIKYLKKFIYRYFVEKNKVFYTPVYDFFFFFILNF